MCVREKERDQNQSNDEIPITNRKFDNQLTTQERHQTFRLHNDCGPRVNSTSHASREISNPTPYFFQILNIRNCVLHGDIAATKMCSSSIERFGGFKILKRVILEEMHGWWSWFLHTWNMMMHRTWHRPAATWLYYTLRPIESEWYKFWTLF